MKKSDFSITAFNDDMREALKDQALNFGAIIACSLEHTVSITARYRTPAGDRRYVTLDKDLSVVDAVDQNDWYYGVSPRLDNDMIIGAISALQFSSLAGLDAFIARHCSLFMLHADQAEYLPDFARYSILSVASNFGVRIRLSKEEAAGVMAGADSDAAIAHWDENILTLRGCPTERILAALSMLRFSRRGKDLWQASDEGIGIRELYADRHNITLLKGKVFYSGVLIKPVHMEKLEGRFENDMVESFVIHYERSTFATVFALDHNYTNHPLLRERKERIIRFFLKDDDQRRELIQSIEGKRGPIVDYLPEINAYLENSYNVNQICVSANVVSGDGKLLMGHRAEGSIDNGSIYPGINGNAELADRNVSSYRTSAYEDYPTIALDQDRSDFFGEISREAYAELKLDLPKLEWHCYGLSLAGIRPDDGADGSDYSIPSRRMHFNLLFEQHVKTSFTEICSGCRSATESFENKDLIGIVVHCYKNRISMVLDVIQDFFERITDQKDVVESLMILILFFSSLLIQGQVEKTWSNAITFLLSLIIILSTGRKVFSALRSVCRTRKQIRRIHLFETMSRETKDRYLHRLLQGYSFHPAAYASLKFYIDNMLFASFFSKIK